MSAQMNHNIFYTKKNSYTISNDQFSHSTSFNPHRKTRAITVPPSLLKIVPISTQDVIPTSQETQREQFKYLDVWKRVKIKIRAQMVLRKLLQSDTNKVISKTSEYESYLLNTKYLERKKNFLDSETETKTETANLPWFILHPQNKLKQIWNVVISFLLVYTVTLMPFAMAFIESNRWDTWDNVDLALDVCFFVEFLMNCLTAYYDKSDVLITEPRKILLSYFKSWMVIDFFSFFPFSLFSSDESAPNNYNNLVRLLRIPKMYRLFKISRLLKLITNNKNNRLTILDSIQEYFSIKNSAIRLVKSLVTILLCLHLAACLWYFSSRLDGFNPDTWVVRYSYLDEPVEAKYLISVYWAFTTLCTVGYGEISGFTNSEKIICTAWMICGLYFFSFTIGSLSSMMSSIDTKENVLLSKLAVIDEFSVEADLSKDLRNKLKHALRYSAEKRGFSWLDKLSIFNELPKSLRHEVALNMHHGAVKELSFFDGKDQSVIATIVPLLQPMYLERNDYVYKKGEFADEIYFIVRGRISYVFGKDEIALRSIQKGSYFGDIEVVKGIGRKYSAKGVRNSELLIMHRQVVQEIIDEHSAVWDEIREVAIEREKTNEKAIVEIQEIISLRKNGKLETINVHEFKKKVNELFEKRLKKSKEKNQVYTLKDLVMRLDWLIQIIRDGDKIDVRKKRNLTDVNLD